MSTDSYDRWRRIHIGSSGLVAVLAIVHAAVSGLAFAHGSRDMGRSLGAALALLLLSGLNVAHIGFEPCPQPTALFVRGANWIFVILGAATIVTVPVPVPEAYAILIGLIGQAVASRWTLPGPLH